MASERRRLWRLLGWDDHDDVGDGPVHPASPRHKFLALALAALLLGLELWAIAGPHEEWPFTSAPMFAHYQRPSDPLFEFRFEAELSDGSKRNIDARRDLRVGEMALKRQFFGRYYGSSDPRNPNGHHPGDTPERFAARLQDFFSRVARVYQPPAGADLVSITLYVDQVSTPARASRRVGRYVVAAAHFEPELTE